MSLPQPEQKYQAQHSSRDFVLPFSALHRNMLALVGGKAANLGELTNAKLSVPPGFCVTTTAYALVAADAGLQSVLDTHATSQAGEGGDAQRLTDLAQASRTPTSTSWASRLCWMQYGAVGPRCGLIER